MNLNQFRNMFPDEGRSRKYLEKVIWPSGRVCPHCGCLKSWPISGKSSRVGLYECGGCNGQFTVTTKTPLHSTKLPLRTWLLAMYCMINSSKGISSVYLAKWLGVNQKTAWKIGHAIRAMMIVTLTILGDCQALLSWMKNTLVANPDFNEASHTQEVKEPKKPVFMSLSVEKDRFERA